ncbi:hypothetical protein [Rhodococcus sp. BH5]|uniref:hypothetical protein n=1 Tax=Rhodococcus sp. BH5 TaxID=2871702 RepID=UPI0022CD8F0B|nr:hypothetical protein [Rhodococcus sp. BH5]MCZ9631340.1 hypothetical protein [Rhodococcus sp. BH5]
MTEQNPLIEEAHVKFAGSSAEMFEMEEVDTKVVFTVMGTIKGDSREKQTNGVKRTMTVSITKVVRGVSEAIYEGDEEDPSLFDSEPSDDHESPSNVVGIGQGPQFSAGD